MPSEDGRATAIWNMLKIVVEDWTCSSEDMIVDRQTHTQTDRQTDTGTLITILRFPIGGGSSSARLRWVLALGPFKK